MESGANGANVPRLVEVEHRKGPVYVTDLYQEEAAKTVMYWDQVRKPRNVTYRAVEVSEIIFSKRGRFNGKTSFIAISTFAVNCSFLFINSITLRLLFNFQFSPFTFIFVALEFLLCLSFDMCRDGS